MATREPIRRPSRLAWPTVLQLAEPTEVIDVWAEGRETYFVVLARLVDGRFAVWSQAEFSRTLCCEVVLLDTKERAQSAAHDLARTIVDCANTRTRA